MAFYQFKKEQVIPSTIEEVWEFISSPLNLKEITPPDMGFDITSDGLPQKMHEGLIISYRLSPLKGIHTTWVTEITHIEAPHFFVDEQRVGPFTLWHHQHRITPHPNGVLMSDIVSYQPPLGPLGAIANAFFIRARLTRIFDYRRKVLEKRFGHTPTIKNWIA
jgi:ligand-binding SRPBCC domain-containing protein